MLLYLCEPLLLETGSWQPHALERLEPRGLGFRVYGLRGIGPWDILKTVRASLGPKNRLSSVFLVVEPSKIIFLI